MEGTAGGVGILQQQLEGWRLVLWWSFLTSHYTPINGLSPVLLPLSETECTVFPLIQQTFILQPLITVDYNLVCALREFIVCQGSLTKEKDRGGISNGSSSH